MSAFLVWIENLSYSTWMRESLSLWAFPGFLFAHTLGMSIVAGGATVISFALLGLWPAGVPIKPLERVYPVLWAGFWLNLFTGVSIFMKDATNYAKNPALYVKLVFVFAGIWLLILTRKRVFEEPELDRAPVSRQAKLLAGASLFCWFSAIVAGRLIAYVGAVH
jgi:hypothetical protein